MDITGRSYMFTKKSGIALVFLFHTQWLGVWKLVSQVKTLAKNIIYRHRQEVQPRHIQINDRALIIIPINFFI